jgi:hypothetical protein
VHDYLSGKVLTVQLALEAYDAIRNTQETYLAYDYNLDGYLEYINENYNSIVEDLITSIKSYQENEIYKNFAKYMSIKVKANYFKEKYFMLLKDIFSMDDKSIGDNYIFYIGIGILQGELLLEGSNTKKSFESLKQLASSLLNEVVQYDAKRKLLLNVMQESIHLVNSEKQLMKSISKCTKFWYEGLEQCAININADEVIGVFKSLSDKDLLINGNVRSYMKPISKKDSDFKDLYTHPQKHLQYLLKEYNEFTPESSKFIRIKINLARNIIAFIKGVNHLIVDNKYEKIFVLIRGTEFLNHHYKYIVSLRDACHISYGTGNVYIYRTNFISTIRNEVILASAVATGGVPDVRRGIESDLLGLGKKAPGVIGDVVNVIQWAWNLRVDEQKKQKQNLYLLDYFLWFFRTTLLNY